MKKWGRMKTELEENIKNKDRMRMKTPRMREGNLQENKKIENTEEE